MCMTPPRTPQPNPEEGRRMGNPRTPQKGGGRGGRHSYCLFDDFRIIYQVEHQGGFMGKVLGIFICPKASFLMQPVPRVKVFADLGLEGDRYGIGAGFWSRPGPKVNRQVSLIAIEDIREA